VNASTLGTHALKAGRILPYTGKQLPVIPSRRKGDSVMRIAGVVFVALLAAGLVAGCSSSKAPVPPPAGGGTATVQGLSTPKSVSVVTAN
jgi:hypothetical protein